MYRNTLTPGQLATWLCAALIPTLLQLAAGLGWLTAGITAAICCAAVFAVWKWGRVIKHPFLACVQYLYIIVLLWNLLPHAALSWPGDNDPAVPLMILVLAAWSAHKGAAASARVACVLFWFVLLIYPAIIASGITEMEWKWLRPNLGDAPWMAATLMLLPCAVLPLRQMPGGWKKRLLLPGAFLVISAAITAGIMSPELAQSLKDPFYTAAQSMHLLGFAQRFEALLSAGMTVGWFCLYAVLLSAAGAWAEQIKPRLSGVGLWLGTVLAALGMLCNLHIMWTIAVILAAVFWVAIPLITQGLVREKKS